MRGALPTGARQGRTAVRLAAPVWRVREGGCGRLRQLSLCGGTASGAASAPAEGRRGARAAR
eukprot:866930-Pleurochrysis_carterae.AAC.1